jgi:hypothetical protein
MSGYNSKGALPTYTNQGGLQPKRFLRSRRGHQPKQFQPFRVQLPDIRPTEVLFVRDKLSDEIIVNQFQLCVSYAGMV